MDTVNERTKWVTTHNFTDENDAPVVPATASYRIDDVGSLAEIHADDTIESLDSSIEIAWTASDTSILDETRPYETRRMTITWTYGSGGNGHAEYFLNVLNLKGVTSPSPA